MKFLLVLLGTLCLSGHAVARRHHKFGPLNVVSKFGKPDIFDAYQPTEEDVRVSAGTLQFLNDFKFYVGPKVDPLVVKKFPSVVVSNQYNSTFNVTNVHVYNTSRYEFTQADVYLVTKNLYFTVRVPELSFTLDVDGTYYVRPDVEKRFSGKVRVQFHGYTAQGRVKLLPSDVVCSLYPHYKLEGVRADTHVDTVEYTTDFDADLNPSDKARDEVFQKFLDGALKTQANDLSRFIVYVPAEAVDGFFRSLGKQNPRC